MAPSSGIKPMVVADVMHRGVVNCRPDTSALAVARMMAAHRIHFVPVIDYGGSCTGVVSDRELELALSSAAPGSILAADIAVAPVIVSPDAKLGYAVALMREHAATHLVVAYANRLVGVLSILDVADAFSNGDGA